MAPLGNPVVPELYSQKAMSSLLVSARLQVRRRGLQHVVQRQVAGVVVADHQQVLQEPELGLNRR